MQLTHNPWNLACSPGGSSGGSAAAVAGRLAPLSLGSDTGGSIRQPAAFCGVVGFKPTYGRVSRFGLVAFGSSLDQIGPIATNTRDIALAMEVIGHHCDRDSTSLNTPPDQIMDQLEESIEGRTIGVPRSILTELVGDIRDNYEASLKVLEERGAKLVDVDLSYLRHSVAIYYIVATAEASTNLARFDGIRYGQRSERAETLEQVYDFSKEEGFGPEVKRRILLGTCVLSSGYQDAYYKQAQRVRTLMIRQYETAFKTCDVVAMPVTPGAAFELNTVKDPIELYLSDLYTISANLAGLPAISVPSGFTHDSKPIGLQLIGPQMKDGRVLKFAHAFEKAVNFTPSIPEFVNQ
jgi:aspartyl-tRNA(Asn)/glutamyl-tRNA(Gln) amidotransferase subunit A